MVTRGGGTGWGLGQEPQERRLGGPRLRGSLGPLPSLRPTGLSLCAEPQLPPSFPSGWALAAGSPSSPSARPAVVWACVTHAPSSGLARVGSQLAKHGAVCSPWRLGVTWREFGGDDEVPLGEHLPWEAEGPPAITLPMGDSATRMSFLLLDKMCILKASSCAQRLPRKPAQTLAYTEPSP